MTVKRRLLMAIATLVALCALVIASAFYFASAYFQRWGQLAVPSQYIDKILAVFLTAVIIIFVFMVATMVIIGFLLINSVLNPLNRLYELAGEIKKGNLDCRVDYQSKDEFGRVFAEFDEMRIRLKASIEKFIEQEADRKEMVASIAHDIKTPVTAVCAHAEGLLHGVAQTPEKQEKYLRTILQKAMVVDQMVNDLYLFSKLDLKRHPFQAESVPLLSYMAHTFEELLAGQSNITFQTRVLLENEPVVNIDPFQFKRVVQNIYQNTLKFCVDGRAQLTLFVYENSENPDSVILKFADDGIGVPADECDKLFDRFFRGDQSRSTTGSGLGLSISKQIVEAMGGRIWARRNEGRGLSIYISLPESTCSQKEKAVAQ